MSNNAGHYIRISEQTIFIINVKKKTLEQNTWAYDTQVLSYKNINKHYFENNYFQVLSWPLWPASFNVPYPK